MFRVPAEAARAFISLKSRVDLLSSVLAEREVFQVAGLDGAVLEQAELLQTVTAKNLENPRPDEGKLRLMPERRLRDVKQMLAGLSDDRCDALRTRVHVPCSLSVLTTIASTHT